MAEEFITECRNAVGCHYKWQLDTCNERASGQPFHLLFLSNLAKDAGDIDWKYPLELDEGVPLGVDSPPLPCEHVWPTKEEMAKCPDDQEPGEPCSRENYGSAAEFENEIEATFVEEREMGLTLGPMDLETAAIICECDPGDICCGALAGIDEGDKVRTVHDGTIVNVNPWIQRNTPCKTTSPGLHDLLWARIRALQFLRTKKSRRQITEIRPAATHGADNGKKIRVTFFKADVTKAHRRIKVRRKDWKYQAAKVKNQVWLNLVGTYGIASAQYYWGRLAALVVRLIYELSADFLWVMVYVDDFMLILPEDTEEDLIVVFLLFLLMIGCPISWKKNKRGVENIWLGFSVNSHTGLAWLPEAKKRAVSLILEALESGELFKAKKILESLGLLQWTATAFPSIRPFLQPMYAWQRATLVAGRPGVLVKYLAATVLALLHSTLRPIFHDGTMSAWQGAADAGASETEATIGGWLTDLEGDDITKDKVWWFSYKMDKEHQPWAFDKGEPKLRIAALELLATVLLVH